jgi:asparagine synthetase B (glutamine-hydrolysing)
MSCWTTASYADNPELAIAKAMAELFGCEHHECIVDPPDTLKFNDQTTVESGGSYPASTQMSAFLPAAGNGCDVLFSGHGLDYTLRGYYLPTRFLEVLGTRGRLPLLKPIPDRPTGKDVLESLRQGPPVATVRRIVLEEKSSDWWDRQAGQMDAVLRPWLDSDDPYNAWDAFILHAVSKHYAFTGMMSTRAVADLSLPSFDNEIFAIYLGISPKMRVAGFHVHKALRRLSLEAARYTSGNSMFRADLSPWMELAAVYGRAALRKLRLASRPALPSTIHSAGSWQNLPNMYRHDPAHRKRFKEIQGRLDGMTFGLLDADALAQCIEEHLSGTAAHTKLLRQLLTHDSWVRCFKIET